VPPTGAAYGAIEVAFLAVQAIASGGLIVVGAVVRSIPSAEILNNQLNTKLDKMGSLLGQLEDSATDAEGLATMTTGWVAERRRTRDRMRKAADALRDDQKKFWSFRFQFKLLRDLTNGEQQRFREREAELMNDLGPNATLKEYNEQVEAEMPDGLLSESELQLVAKIIKSSTGSQRGVYSKVDDIIEWFLSLKTRDSGGSESEDAWLRRFPDVPDKKERPVEEIPIAEPGPPSPRDSLSEMSAGLRKHRTRSRSRRKLRQIQSIDTETDEVERVERVWSMKNVINMIGEAAKANFPDEYRESIKPWQKEFEETTRRSSATRNSKQDVGSE